MKIVVAGAFAVFLAACSGAADSSSNGTTTSTSSASTWNDTDMQTLVATKCATSSCHAGAQKPNYSGISEAAMLSDTQALAQVKAGKMPEKASLTPAEYDTFIAFYGN